MDKVKFSESYSHLYDASNEPLPSNRYEGMEQVLKTITYSGNVYIMGETDKVQMYQDVDDAVRFAASGSLANARFFEKNVNEFLKEKGYESDCVVSKVIEIDHEVGGMLKHSTYVSNYKESEDEPGK